MELVTDSNWSSEAAQVLARACAHAGGSELWHSLRVVRLVPGRLSGFVPWLKGVGPSFERAGAFEVEPRLQRTRFLGYPDPEHDGVYDAGKVRIERRADRKVVFEAERHRASFRGLAGYRRWSHLDALYFFGYALCHYHSLPFSLFDARLLQHRVVRAANSVLDALEVELPKGLHTHCRRQRFYFAANGQLIRHDYQAEIVGVWALGAHYWNRQVSCSGLSIALERHVFARIGGIALPITALLATFDSAEAEFAP